MYGWPLHLHVHGLGEEVFACSAAEQKELEAAMVDEEENQCAAARDETNAPGLRQARGSIALPRTAVNIVTARRCARSASRVFIHQPSSKRNIHVYSAGLEASPHTFSVRSGGSNALSCNKHASHGSRLGKGLFDDQTGPTQRPDPGQCRAVALLSDAP